MESDYDYGQSTDYMTGRNQQEPGNSHETPVNAHPACESKHIKAGYPGTSGSFSEEALIRYFGEAQERVAYTEFEDVFEALKTGEINYGVLPIENSFTGAVSATYDLLRNFDFYITGEIYLSISQNLIGLPGTKLSEIEEIYSHSQGLEQSSHFLKRHPSWRQVPYPNTALAAELVKKAGDKRKAAIASERAAAVFGLEVLMPRINNSDNNTTRFVVVGRELLEHKHSNKISIVCSMEHKAGFLYHLLGNFAENNLNLVRIESRPFGQKNFEYCLYLDFEGDIQSEAVRKTFATIKEQAGYFQLLGAYVKEM